MIITIISALNSSQKYFIPIAIALIVVIPIAVVTTKGDNKFKRQCNKVVNGMTLQDVMLIMGMKELVYSEKPKYKWEHICWSIRRSAPAHSLLYRCF